MVLRIYLLKQSGTLPATSSISSALNKWCRYYMPPWTFLFHILEIISIIFFCNNIISPTIDGVYHMRKEFTDLFFSDHDESKPFNQINDISDFIDTFKTNIEKFSKDSFANMQFLNEDQPYTVKIRWKNGTATDYFSVDVTAELFNHIQDIDFSMNFITYSNDTDVVGCTEWKMDLLIGTRNGGYEFLPTYIFQRTYCRGKISYQRGEMKNLSRNRIYGHNEVFSYRTDRVRYDHNREDYDKNLIKEVQEAIKQGTLNEYVPPKHEVVKDTFNCFILSLYPPMQRFSIIFVVIGILGFYMSSITIVDSFAIHKMRLAYDGVYKEYSSFDQFHTSIGLWNTLFLLKSIFTLAFSIFVIVDTNTISQYPQNKTLYAFGISAFFSISCFIRWMMYWPKIYRIVNLIVNGARMLMMMIISQIPFLFALMFSAIYLFGFVANATDSIVKLLKLFIAFIFGDSLYGNYTEFSDGSSAYNTMSFVFNSCLISVLIWLFFTSYTGLITWVDHHFNAQQSSQ